MSLGPGAEAHLHSELKQLRKENEHLRFTNEQLDAANSKLADHKAEITKQLESLQSTIRILEEANSILSFQKAEIAKQRDADYAAVLQNTFKGQQWCQECLEDFKKLPYGGDLAVHLKASCPKHGKSGPADTPGFDFKTFVANGERIWLAVYMSYLNKEDTSAARKYADIAMRDYTDRFSHAVARDQTEISGEAAKALYEQTQVNGGVWRRTMQFRWYEKATVRQDPSGFYETYVNPNDPQTPQYLEGIPILQQRWVFIPSNSADQPKSEWRSLEDAFETLEEAKDRAAKLNAARAAEIAAKETPKP
jgi:hypothetical protein